jgi:gamma-glutamyl-gamma-aminobutyrate hydrolase PuuD
LSRPRIGITTGITARWAPNGASYRPYRIAVEAAGGQAVHLSPTVAGDPVGALAGLSGIVFTGGKDIHLAHYPNPPECEDFEHTMVRHRMHPEPERDVYELPLLREALQQDLPVLGICRGCQVLNVALGGRLILDIPTEVPTDLDHTSWGRRDDTSSLHPVRVFPDTLLAEILPPDLYTRCNSRHHQAVRLDETFTARVSAVSPEDGVVEAIEVPGRRWAVGVQWHPEHQADAEIRAASAPLFTAFVTVAGG